MPFPILEALTTLEDELGNQLIIPRFNGLYHTSGGTALDEAIRLAWEAFKLEDGDVVKTLNRFDDSNISNSALSIEDVADAADYQTPGSGTIPIVAVVIKTFAAGSSRDISLITNDTADSSATEVEEDIVNNIDGDDAVHTLIGYDLPNSKFVNIKNNHASNIRIQAGWAVERP